MKSPNWLSKNRSSDPYPPNKTRYNQFVEVAFGVRAPFGRPSPLTPLRNAAAGRAGHSSSSTGGVEAKKHLNFKTVSPFRAFAHSSVGCTLLAHK